ncbi:MAG: hypothetical protein JWR35_3006 [Marmoricola sp.]|nr:hypothetical protein [Marmoricola sp.]
MPDNDDDRTKVLGLVLLKVAGVVIGIALVVGLGTKVLVSTLGLSGDNTTTTVGSAGPIDDTPLPTTALPVPSDSPTQTPSDNPTDGSPGLPTGTPSDDLSFPSDAATSGRPTLSVSPVYAKPDERINLTGTYPNKDSIDLQVQRMEAGVWKDFPATVSVHVGTFATYVLTSRAGDNQFRVWDAQDKVGSNIVTVTID